MSIKEVPELLVTHPAVFAVDREYQIMFPVTREMLVSVKCGGEEYFPETEPLQEYTYTYWRTPPLPTPLSRCLILNLTSTASECACCAST